ncbi:hypothetical protein TTRE_0000444401 [Trichuris trichiura]|uniref:Uncharacterized protein n=1 Tax=Trichuris trichiura TaxID=36087 RepID=A0A077Z8V3_TRITR|nr:hypothetical protein TTRE_0000444401 [Trichuris trichiura]
MFSRCVNLLVIPGQVSAIFFRGIYKKRFYRGIYLTDSMMARKDDVLVRMRNLDYVPGVNVSYSKEGYDRVLRAMCDGIVTITTEAVQLDLDHFGMTQFYEWRKDVPMRKLCFNVIPKSPSRTFRLVEEI